MIDALTFTDLIRAHDEVVPVIWSVPDRALEWKPAAEEFSLKQVIVHLAEANDFYVMIVEEVRANKFSDVKFRQDSMGWQRMGATDAEAMQYTTTSALHDCFERTFQRLLAVLRSITTEEIDRPFAFYGWQVEAEPLTTTLRQRVIQTATNHIREHHAQLINTLGLWQAAQMKSA